MERHQLKWLIAVAVVAAIALPIAFLVPESLLASVALGVGLVATVRAAGGDCHRDPALPPV